LHGAWLLLFVSLLPFVLRLIPTASLGAVLVYTGYKLMNLQAVREMKAYGRSEIWIYCATVAAIVTTNLLIGVLLGLGLAVAKLLYTTQNLDSYYWHDPKTGKLNLEISGIATFLSLPRLAKTLEQAPPFADISVRIDRLRHIDHACLNLLKSWEKLHLGTGGKVRIDWTGLQNLSRHANEVRNEPDDSIEQLKAG
ncbi:MAG: SulP family inorganic anion transporter, partial [Nitrospiraceae bacterium]